jgi:hypothetical protein
MNSADNEKIPVSWVMQSHMIEDVVVSSDAIYIKLKEPKPITLMGKALIAMNLIEVHNMTGVHLPLTRFELHLNPTILALPGGGDNIEKGEYHIAIKPL